MASTAGPHILLYPYPAPGHIIPLLDLASRLLVRGLSITVALTPDTTPLLQPLHLTSVHSFVLPSPEPPPENSTTPRIIFRIRSLKETHREPLLQWFRSQPSPPIAIISDFFLGWTNTLAAEVGVRRLVFSPSGAFGYSVNISLALNPPTRTDGIVQILDIPNCPKYRWYQISSGYRDLKEGDPDREFYRGNWLENIASWGVVINSFTDFEQPYIDYLKKVSGHCRVWAIGPLLPSDGDLFGPEVRGGLSPVPYHDLLTWLDAHADDSVLYVCFGSRYVLTRKQMDELAGALDKSGVHFIWCVSRQVFLPDDFKVRVGDRGFLISGWAPQVAILRHRAVGAFLSHCGWNSTMEAVTAGVVMLAWPMEADQFTNAQLLVNELGVGIRVGDSNVDVPESTKLARLLVEVMMVHHTPEKDQVKKLSKAAFSAVNREGSSEKDLDALVVKILSELES